MDAAVLEASFAAVAPRAGELVRFFYGHLFAAGGQDVIGIFPPDQSYVREHLTAALAQVVELAGDPGRLGPVMAALGVAHRKHGIGAAEFDLVAGSLLAALAEFAGDGWTPEVAGAWEEAYGLVSAAMQAGMAEDAAAGNPPWWDGVVVAAENRTYDIVTLTVQLTRPMGWEPGESVSVQFDTAGPRIWRALTPANVPRPAQTMDFHVQVVPGGLMSVPLALRAAPGQRLRVARMPGSTLRLADPPGRDIVMVAGGTGLTPMLAMLDRLAALDDPPDVRLFAGARRPEGLYEAERLEKLAREHGWLTVTCAVSGSEPGGYDGERGSIVDVAAAAGPWDGRDAYICGGPAMVRAGWSRLRDLGVPAAQVHVENFGWEGELADDDRKQPGRRPYGP